MFKLSEAILQQMGARGGALRSEDKQSISCSSMRRSEKVPIASWSYVGNAAGYLEKRSWKTSSSEARGQPHMSGHLNNTSSQGQFSSRMYLAVIEVHIRSLATHSKQYSKPARTYHNRPKDLYQNNPSHTRTHQPTQFSGRGTGHLALHLPPQTCVATIERMAAPIIAA